MKYRADEVDIFGPFLNRLPPEQLLFMIISGIIFILIKTICGKPQSSDPSPSDIGNNSIVS